jgi:hypothetical protein
MVNFFTNYLGWFNLFRLYLSRGKKLGNAYIFIRKYQENQKMSGNTLKYKEIGSFSEESDKIGRGFIKILETWQFGLSFNIIRQVFFSFGQKKFFVGFTNF